MFYSGSVETAGKLPQVYLLLPLPGRINRFRVQPEEAVLPQTVHSGTVISCLLSVTPPYCKVFPSINPQQTTLFLGGL